MESRASVANSIINQTMIAKSLLKITRSNIGFKLPSTSRYLFCSLRQKLQQTKRSKTLPKTEIVSLSSEEMHQLSFITHYSTAISYLEKNELETSAKYLQFALNDIKSKHPESINLQMCIMNRVSILQKLMNRSAEFAGNLQEIFFMCLSLKGEKSLQTLKHFHNYLNALILDNPARIASVLEFLKESGFKFLMKQSEMLLGIGKFLCGQRDSGLSMIRQSSQETIKQKYIKLNNLGWLTAMRATDQNLDFVPKQKINQIESSLSNLITSLVEAENCGQVLGNNKEVEENLAMLSYLKQSLNELKSDADLIKIKPTTLLMNSQSHIIAMNIAHVLFLLKKYEEAIIFMKMGIETSLQLQEPERLGLGLVLLSRLNHRLKAQWQQIILDVLLNKQMYSRGVIKQALSTYAKLLFTEHRYFEAEDYINQSERIQADPCIEGLILPDYDFSF